MNFGEYYGVKSEVYHVLSGKYEAVLWRGRYGEMQCWLEMNFHKLGCSLLFLEQAYKSKKILVIQKVQKYAS